MSAFVVVNPRSASGATGRDWKATARTLEKLYPHMAVAFTRHRGEAAHMVRTALREGHHEVIAVGGDGTINEAVNGFFDVNGAISPDAVFGFVTSGTGGDFRKTFGIATGSEAAIARLGKAVVRAIDVGRVSCLSARGESITRYFINIASFGMSGLIVDSVNRARIAKLFGGAFAFAFHSAMGALRYRERPVRLIAGEFDSIAPISTVAVANGRFFGGGMMVAPSARTDDGLFDVIVMGGGSRSQTLSDMKQIYTGEHVNNPNVKVVRAPKVVAVPVADTGGRAVLIETDGESAGRLPATFEILPRALNLRC
ncbi:MAG TPA: diacylglycerol kinase family protein [Rhizomicrobium sp.]|jgi:YegS/Rv2252/BmrU family lipid kinase